MSLVRYTKPSKYPKKPQYTQFIIVKKNKEMKKDEKKNKYRCCLSSTRDINIQEENNIALFTVRIARHARIDTIRLYILNENTPRGEDRTDDRL